MTEKDANIFAQEVVGYSVAELQKAGKDAMNGNGQALKDMIENIATHTQTTPEKVSSMMTEIFF